MGNNVLFAFLLTLFAGLATGIGSALAVLTKKTNTKFLAVSLGFSAGIMIYVSMIELFPQAQKHLTDTLGMRNGQWVTILAFFGGMGLIAVIDKFVTTEKNPHEVKLVEAMDTPINQQEKLLKMGVMTALAVGIHNFPEGLATFASALTSPSLGIPIALSIAIHNIPEGIAVSVPIYYATGDKRKAFKYSFLSGMSEPIGALVGYTMLRPFFNDVTFGILFAMVAGIMVFISFDELLPSAREYGEHHLSIYGLIGGMIVMAISIVLLS